jgi:hypothetical protein
MGNPASGGGATTIITYPGTGIKYSTSQQFARIKVLTYSNLGSINSSWVPVGRTDVLATPNNTWTATSATGAAATDNINPQLFNNERGWECRRQYTTDYKASAGNAPDILGNNANYRIQTSIYWQGSETGNCGGLNALGTGATLASFNNAVSASALPQTSCVEYGTLDEVYCTFDMWFVHVQILTDYETLNPLTNKADCVAPFMMTVYDEFTGKVLNTRGQFQFS